MIERPGAEAGPALDPAAVADLRGLQREHGPQAVARAVGSFLESGSERLAALRVALAKGDTAAASWLAHSLRGSSGLFGARRVAALCQELEVLAAQEAAMETLAALVDRLEHEFERVRRELEQLR